MLLTFISLEAYSETQVFEADARVDGQLVYFERHTAEYEHGIIQKTATEYHDPKGTIIGSMASDFSESLSSPDYSFHDFRQQNFYGLRKDKNKLEAFTQEGKEAQVAVRKISVNKELDQVSGAGLIYFIGANLKKIIASKVIDFQYIIPGRLEAFDFYVEAIAHNSELIELEVKMKLWPMRFFGPRIRLVYDAQRKRLVYYEGVSNLRTEEGKMMNVEIRYRYQD
jgi:hypothetical protein